MPEQYLMWPFFLTVIGDFDGKTKNYYWCLHFFRGFCVQKSQLKFWRKWLWGRKNKNSPPPPPHPARAFTLGNWCQGFLPVSKSLKEDAGSLVGTGQVPHRQWVIFDPHARDDQLSFRCPLQHKSEGPVLFLASLSLSRTHTHPVERDISSWSRERWNLRITSITSIGKIEICLCCLCLSSLVITPMRKWVNYVSP